jgi:thiamine kinase-like enzyme
MSTPAPWPSAAALAWVPGAGAGAAPLRVERLLGGSVNDSWRVDTAKGRFVLRVDGPAWRRPGVDRVREQSLHEAAARAGLAPGLLLRADRDGVQVCEYLDGRCWTAADFMQADQLRRLGDRLARLHALDVPPGVAPFDPVASARAYLQALSPEAIAAMQAQERVAEIELAARRVAQGTSRLAIVHGDLTHANLLDGTQLWLLDWEYAQRADPLYDVACALAYYPQARPLAPQLLAAAGLPDTDLGERLAAAIRVYEGLSTLWQGVRGDPRPD